MVTGPADGALVLEFERVGRGAYCRLIREFENEPPHVLSPWIYEGRENAKARARREGATFRDIST